VLTVSKISIAKWTRDVAKVVECLLCKCKALSSKPQPLQKKKVSRRAVPAGGKFLDLSPAKPINSG
jgi:hypothetical protein